jgi:hypothetical protein
VVHGSSTSLCLPPGLPSIIVISRMLETTVHAVPLAIDFAPERPIWLEASEVELNVSM